MSTQDENSSQLKQDIIRCLQEQDEMLTIFRNSIGGKDVVILLGNTRSGKSTLANYIIGAKLEGWESAKMDFKVRAVRPDLGPDIGQGSLSCTANPGVYPMQGRPDVVVVDPPGFEDNRGVVQDIINALSISHIKYARTVKFVLVSDINEITCDNIRNFTNSLQQVQALVCNFDKLKNSFSIVFTKDWRDYTQAEIVELFRNKILNSEMDIDRVLIRNFAENPKFIGICRMPTQMGEISTEIDINVKSAIEASRGVDVEKCEIKFALSDKAQGALLQVYPEYTDTSYFEQEINEMIKRYTDYFDVDKYVYASYDNELASTRSAMEKIASAVLRHKEENFIRLFEIQASLDSLLEVNETVTSSEFKQNFKFIIMLDQSSLLEENYKDMITTNYKNSLSKLFGKVDALLQKIDAEVTDRKKDKIFFSVGGFAGVVGFAPAFIGSAKVVDCVAKVGSAVKKVTGPCATAYGACEAVIGGAVTTTFCIGGAALVGAGAGSAYVLYKQTYGKRLDARKDQGRRV